MTVKEASPTNKEFVEVVNLIRKAKYEAIKSVNQELIQLYWNVGSYIYQKLQNAEWGEQVIHQLALFITKHYPEIKGFSTRNLFRMKQFYETYKDATKVSALLTQLTWTNNITILSKTKSLEEREFYIHLCIKEQYSSRELERQIDSCFYERTLLSKKVSPLGTQIDSSPPTLSESGIVAPS